MPKKKTVTQDGLTPYLGQLALVAVMVISVFLALVALKMNQDNRGNANTKFLAPLGDIPINVWPEGEPIPIGTGSGQFKLKPDYSLMQVVGSKLVVTQPVPTYYATFPVFTDEFTWDTTTSVKLYGWTKESCTGGQSTEKFRVNGVYLVGGKWESSSTASVAFPQLNQLGSDPSQSNFCVPDTVRGGGWNAIRMSVTSAGNGGATQAMSVDLYAVNGDTDQWEVAKITVDTPLEAWPPGAPSPTPSPSPVPQQCGQKCASQIGLTCAPGLVCDYSKTQREFDGVCVIPECNGQACTCTAGGKD